LRDQSFVFALRLKKLGVDVKLREFGLLPHGFLNFNSPFMGFKDEAN
jgi:acetyl esterase/lipase